MTCASSSVSSMIETILRSLRMAMISDSTRSTFFSGTSAIQLSKRPVKNQSASSAGGWSAPTFFKVPIWVKFVGNRSRSSSRLWASSARVKFFWSRKVGQTLNTSTAGSRMVSGFPLRAHAVTTLIRLSRPARRKVRSTDPKTNCSVVRRCCPSMMCKTSTPVRPSRG